MVFLRIALLTYLFSLIDSLLNLNEFTKNKTDAEILEEKLSLKCKVSDITYTVEDCDNKGKRKIILNSDNPFCLYSKNYTRFPFEITLNENVSLCKHICKQGQKLEYDVLAETMYCSNCPINHYNLGKDLRYCGKTLEWVDDMKDKGFKTNCVVLEESLEAIFLFRQLQNLSSYYKKFEYQSKRFNCTPFKTTNEFHSFTSGKIVTNEIINRTLAYYGELEVSFDFKQDTDTATLFGYLKRSIILDHNNKVNNLINLGGKIVGEKDVYENLNIKQVNGVMYYYIDDKLTYIDDFTNNSFEMSMFFNLKELLM